MEVNLINASEEELLASVSGRVDATNAEELYDALNELREAHPQGTFVLDGEKMDYISSAGLRGLLRLQKKEKQKIGIVNLSLEVMEIFEITGFADILDVHRKLRSISIEGCEKIGQGANGQVYQLTRDSIVKVYLPQTRMEDIKRERDLAQKAFVKGIPTAITFDVVEVGECKGVVFEMLDAVSLAAVINEHMDRFEEYADEYVALYKTFHQTRVEGKDFPSVKDIYDGYIDGCKDWYTPEELEQIRSLVRSVPDRDTLIHGDFHVRNIMVQQGELIMIDMGDVSYGHPIFDFLATAATQANLVELNPEYAVVHTGMPVETIKRLWTALLQKYFVGKSQEEIARIDKQIRFFSKLKVALAPVVGAGAPQEIIEASVQDAKANLLPHIKEWIGSIDW